MNKFNPWPVGIIVFFIFIALLNGFILYLSLQNDRVLVEDSPYEKGIEFQKEIDEQSEASKQSLSLIQTVNTKSHELEVRLVKDSMLPVLNARIIASFMKASESKKDMQRELLMSEEGVYKTSVADVSGFYIIKYLVIYNEKRIRFEEKVNF